MQENSCERNRSKKDGLMETERKRIPGNKGGGGVRRSSIQMRGNLKCKNVEEIYRKDGKRDRERKRERLII